MAEEMKFDAGMAKEYERGVRRTLPTYDAMFRMIQSFIRKDVKEDASILVVGAGGGMEIGTFGPQNPKWTFTGVDPADSMIALAKQKAMELNLHERTMFITGTVQDVPDTEMFDAATCILVLHFIHDYEEKHALLKKISSQLKPNSPFVLVSMFGDKENVEFDEKMALWKQYWLDNTQLSESEVDKMKKSVTSLSFLLEEEIRSLLKEAGFVRVTKFFETTIFGGWICYSA